MKEDRFSYQKGDICIGASQCAFCRFNVVGAGGESSGTCAKYPEGKPEEIAKTEKRCPYLEN